MTQRALSTVTVPADINEFAGIPRKYRQDVRRWTRALPLLETGWTLEQVAKHLHVSTSTVRRKEKAFAADGWRGLVPDYKGPSELPPAFIAHVATLIDRARVQSARTALKKIMRDWQSRVPIPGYEGHPGWPNRPPGWSERNLYRIYKKHRDKLAADAFSRGLGFSIAKHGPKVLTTRVNLYPFSHIPLDDVDGNDFCHVLAARQLARVSEVGAMDLFAGDRFAFGSMPRLVTAGGVTERIKERQVRFLIAWVLYRWGYSPRGTVFLPEHGTAAIREWMEALLYDWTGGLITVRRSGMTGKEQAVAGFWGNGKGNPRHKSLLENFHRIMQNAAALLPGQTGRSVAERPEHLDGVLNDDGLLLRIMDQLTPRQRELLKLGTLEYHSERQPLIQQIYDGIAWDSDHKLEGWAELGHFTKDYRLSLDSDQWITREKFLALPDAAQQVLALSGQHDPRLERVRRLSRREVFLRGEPTLVRPPAGLIAEILFEDLAEERTVRACSFEMTDSNVAPGKMFFEGRVISPEGQSRELKNGEKFATVLNPFSPDCLWIYDAAGAFLGIAPRQRRVDPTNQEAMERELGHQRARLAERLAPLRKEHAQITREATLRAKANADALGGSVEDNAETSALALQAERALSRRALSQQSVTTTQKSETTYGDNDDY
jgi:hypothetical protein